MAGPRAGGVKAGKAVLRQRAQQGAVGRHHPGEFLLHPGGVRQGILGLVTPGELSGARAGAKTHAIEHVLIAGGREHLVRTGKVVLAGRCIAPQHELVLQVLRDGRGIAVVAPECGVAAFRENVVQLEEFDDPVPAIAGHGVEPAGDEIHRAARGGQTGGDIVGRQLDQHQGRCFQRFEEPGGQAHGHHVVFPEQRAMARADRDFARGQAGETGADIGGQFLLGAIGAGVAAGIDIADAAPRRQADVPDPAMLLRGGNGVRGNRAVGLDRQLHRQRAIDEQHVGPVDERHLQRFAQQPRGKAGAIHEQIGRDRPAALPDHRAHVAILGALDAHDLVVDVAHAQLLRGMAGQQLAQLHRIEVIGIVGDAGIFGRSDQLGRQPCSHRNSWKHTASENDGAAPCPARPLRSSRAPGPDRGSLRAAPAGDSRSHRPPPCASGRTWRPA
jgi:hypothetical protein